MRRENLLFKYFNMWALDPHFKQVVKGEWDKTVKGNLMFQLVTKLSRLKWGLKKLNQNRFGDIENKVQITRIALHAVQEELRVQPLNANLISLEKELTDEFVLSQKALHQFLAQKAKVEWLQMGDDNTHFFHTQIKTRRAHDKVLQIKDKKGDLCVENADIQNAFVTYYQELLGSSTKVDNISLPLPVVHTERVLTTEHHSMLLTPTTSEEVKAAMYDICGTKAPGPSKFYKYVPLEP
ncbi:uncharacterized protein LOC141649622 [Silene latifolia]|uniref:uncharacterized protein LOC141649622 n=1 Tax=Silene latifolia TaxID=37657 RepID=UPI003D778C29